MKNLNAEPRTAASRALARVLHSISLICVASAALIVFVVIPYVLLEHWHLLPDWQVLRLIVLSFPIVIAWDHAGLYIILIVAGCEGMLLKLKTATSKEKAEVSLKIAVCVLAYLFLYVGNRFNFH